MRQKPNKAVLSAIAVVHVGMTTLTWRDLRHRPAEAIRGNKTLWRVVSAANTAGSLAYWLFGRK